MATVNNETIVRSLFEQALNKRDSAALNNLISPDYHGFQGLQGPLGFEKPILPLIQAFPDIQWHIEDLFGTGDKVVARWKWEGTHTASFNGRNPTGRSVTNEGLAIFELEDSQIVNAHLLTDRLAFLQALDVLPQDLNQLYRQAN